MWRKIVILAGALASVAGSAAAGDRQVCITSLEGRWVVESYVLDDVSAVSDQEARRMVGATVQISRDLVTFPGASCRVKQVVREPAEFHDGEARDLRDYPLEVAYACSPDAALPAFRVGRDCFTIYASLDGANYRLVRTGP